jgi:phosphoadenosine phosphosulfate reductase
MATVIDTTPVPGPQAELARRLSARFEGRRAEEILAEVIFEDFKGQIALSSSFGADAAVMLHLVSEIDKSLPVIFLDTDRHFYQTLQYRDQLVERFGFTNLINLKPDAGEVGEIDARGDLWSKDPDACCALRKVWPLDRVMENYTTWISGRKRHQAVTRTNMAIVEWDSRHYKVNPLAAWSHQDVLDYIKTHNIPPHPLVEQGYPSIGCYTCTSPVAEGDDARAGRWAGTGKVECGIHIPAPAKGRPMAF